MKQLVCFETGRLEIVDAPTPAIGAGEVLLRMNVCGICGTDLMKVYSDAVAKPVQLGHEIVGTICAVGSGIQGVAPGQRVAVAHHVPDYSSHYTRRGSAPLDAQFKLTNIDPGGFAEYIRLPALHVQHTLEVVRDDIPDLRAVFMEPLACCLRALDRVPVAEGDTVMIVGAGGVGLLFAPLLRDRSARVLAVDVRRERLEIAQQWGADDGFLIGVDDGAGGAHRCTHGRGADVVILTVFNRPTVELALAAVRDGGVVLLFGVKPGAVLDLDFWQLWRRELNIVSSYSSTPDLLPRAMAILRRPEYTLETTVSHTLPLAEAPYGFQLVHDGLASKAVIVNDE